ncbi:MAG: serine hydrolase domain-containing protein [Tistlia sp.]|uniref:serine hydrolase domain-containing protein n=1 Tax=Tistlia sp. TaxID=3057121 RepID=UPI0034A58F78
MDLPALRAAAEAQCLAAKGPPGLALALAYADGSVRSACVGHARLGDTEAVTPQTWFRLGSISKVVTALAVLHRLLGAGDDPDRPLGPSAFGADPRRAPDSVTPAALLCHVAGLPDGAALGTPALGDATSWLACARPFGRRFSYSNLGYALLGAWLQEQVGGSETWLRQHALEPFGLRNIAFAPPPGARRAAGHVLDPAAGALAPFELAFTDDRLGPAGFLWATADGLGSLATALLSPPDELCRGVVERLTTPGSEAFGAGGLRMGHGLFLLDRGGRRIGFHDGEIGGFRSLLQLDLAAGHATCVLSNLSGPEHGPRDLLAAAARKGDVKSAVKPVPPAAPEAAPAGTRLRCYLSAGAGLLELEERTPPRHGRWNGAPLALAPREPGILGGVGATGPLQLRLPEPKGAAGDRLPDHLHLNGQLFRACALRSNRTRRFDPAWQGRYDNGYWIEVKVAPDGRVVVASTLTGFAEEALALGARSLACSFGLLVFRLAAGRRWLRALALNGFAGPPTAAGGDDAPASP